MVVLGLTWITGEGWLYFACCFSDLAAIPLIRTTRGRYLGFEDKTPTPLRVLDAVSLGD